MKIQQMRTDCYAEMSFISYLEDSVRKMCQRKISDWIVSACEPTTMRWKSSLCHEGMIALARSRHEKAAMARAFEICNSPRLMFIG
jgi:hypothetical protein